MATKIQKQLPVESIEKDLNLTFQTYIPLKLRSLLKERKELGEFEIDKIINGLHGTGKLAKYIKKVVDDSTVHMLKFYYEISGEFTAGDDEWLEDAEDSEDGDYDDR